MKKYNIFLVFVLLLIYLASCKSNNKHADSESSFVPHPQSVEKQEVKTLEIASKAPDFTLPDMNGKKSV